MSSGYTKLFHSILHSTVWGEDNPTRILWITMLAMADKHGVVHAAVPGLARAANISLEDTEKALKKFLAPDPYSRTPDFEGRRIEATLGGWTLLNHAKYREMMSVEERKEYNRQKQQEHRDRKKRAHLSNAVNDSQSQSAKSAHTEAEAEEKADTKAKSTQLPSSPATTPVTDSDAPPSVFKGSVDPAGQANQTRSALIPIQKAKPVSKGFTRSDAEEIYEAYPKHVAKDAALKAIGQRLSAGLTKEFLLDKTRRYATARRGQDAQYTPNPATWFNAGRFNDDEREWTNGNSRAAKNPALVYDEQYVADLREKERIFAESAGSYDAPPPDDSGLSFDVPPESDGDIPH